MHRLMTCLALSLALTPCLATAAHAAGWGPGRDVAVEPIKHRPQVTGLPGGGFLVTWIADHQRLRAAWIDAAGTIGPPVDVTRAVSGHWTVAVDPQGPQVYIAVLARQPALFTAAPGGTFGPGPGLPADTKVRFPEQEQLVVRSGHALFTAPDAAFSGPAAGPLTRIPLQRLSNVDAATVLPDGSDLLLLLTVHGRLRPRTRTTIDAVRRAPDGTLSAPAVLATGRFNVHDVSADFCVPWGGGAAAAVAIGTRRRIVELDGNRVTGTIAFPAGTRLTLRGSPSGRVIALAARRGSVTVLRIGEYGVVSQQALDPAVVRPDARIDDTGAAVVAGTVGRDGPWRTAFGPAGSPFGAYGPVGDPPQPFWVGIAASAGVAAAVYDTLDQARLRVQLAPIS